MVGIARFRRPAFLPIAHLPLSLQLCPWSAEFPTCCVAGLRGLLLSMAVGARRAPTRRAPTKRDVCDVSHMGRSCATQGACRHWWPVMTAGHARGSAAQVGYQLSHAILLGVVYSGSSGGIGRYRLAIRRPSVASLRLVPQRAPRTSGPACSGWLSWQSSCGQQWRLRHGGSQGDEQCRLLVVLAGLPSIGATRSSARLFPELVKGLFAEPPFVTPPFAALQR